MNCENLNTKYCYGQKMIIETMKVIVIIETDGIIIIEPNPNL